MLITLEYLNDQICRLKRRVHELEQQQAGGGGAGIPVGGTLDSFVQDKINQSAIYFDNTHFAGDGSQDSPLRVIGGGGGGSGSGSGSATGTTSPLTFGSVYTNTAGVITNPAGQSFHQANPAQQVIPAGQKGRVWVRADNTDSDFVLGINTTGTGNYQSFVNSFQLSYFQGNQRVYTWSNNVQTLVKNTVVSYVGILRNSDDSVSLQESFDGKTWVDIASLTAMPGNVFVMLSMTNSGKVYEPKLTLY